MSEQQKKSVAIEVGEHGLKQHDLKVRTVVFMIFCLCAAGAYGIEEMIPESGPGVTLVMLIVLAFIWAIPFALVAAELGSARPQEGGYYKWVQEALGEFWGFQAGWWRTISIYIDNTLYVILVGGYISSQWDLSPTMLFAVKAIMIIVFVYINIRGVKDVGAVSTILAILTIIAFAMVAICGFMNWQQNPFVPFTADGEITGLAGIGFADMVYYIGMGIAIGVWMYAGYESMSTIAGEVKDPQVIPKATLIAVPLIMCVYIFPTMAGLASLGDWPNWGTEADTIGYADVITTYWGPALGIFFVVVAVLAQSSIYNTYIASGSRGFFALADDHLAPPILVKCDKKHGVPYISVLSVGIVNLILCNFGFKQVLVVDTFLLVSSYVMIFISALILRKRINPKDYKFKIPGGYGALCVACILPMLVAFTLFFINGTDYFIGGMIGVASGPVMYFIWKRMYGGLAKKNAKLYPLNPKTKLAVGDLRKIGKMFVIFAIAGLIATPWLTFFEGDWGPNYYDDPAAVMEEWEAESMEEVKAMYFEDMEVDESYFGAVGAEFFVENEDGEVLIPGYYAEEYGNFPLGNFEGMLNAIKIATGLFAVLGIILLIVAAKVEPKKTVTP